MADELTSIIMPSYNCEATIAHSIMSVLAQTYTNWELLIVDDCSSDGSVLVAQRFAQQDSRIRVIQRDWNAGPAVTRNRAISEAKGRFIAFLDADDSWHPQKLERQLQFMKTNKVALCYSAYRRLNEQGEFLGVVQPPSSLEYKDLLKSCRIGCLTAIYDTKLLGGKVYMPNIANKREDFALWLKILRTCGRAYGLNEILADYTVASSSVSSNKLVAAKYQWRVYREVERLSWLNAAYYFCHYAINGVLRRL